MLKKFFKNFFILILDIFMCIFLLGWGFLGGYFFRMLTARLYDKYEYYLFVKEFEKTPAGQLWSGLKKDYYGGITPQETWKKFLKAVRNNDFETASRYFWVVDENERLRIKNSIPKYKDIILSYPEKIILVKEPNFAFFDMPDYEYLTATYYNNQLYGAKLTFRKNDYTGVWKIYEYIDVITEYPPPEEKYKEITAIWRELRAENKITEEQYIEKMKNEEQYIRRSYIPEYLKVKKIYELTHPK